MKYDESTSKLLTTSFEMVRIAKRGISPTLPNDEDELSKITPRESVKEKLIGKTSPETLTYEFSEGGHDFRLSCTLDVCGGNNVTLIRAMERGYSHPRKKLVELTRAEGFIAGYAYANANKLDGIILTIVYIDQERYRIEQSEELVTIKKLTSFFDKCKTSLLLYASPEIERVTRRLPTLKKLKFPYEEIRQGQSELVREVYRAIASGGELLAEAPTGTGKTASVIFPALRAIGEGKCDKVFYFTPKTTTANAARDCLELMASRGAILRGLIITAKEKICIGNHACRDTKDSCVNSKFNKLPDAILELYSSDKPVIAFDDIRDVATKYSVCPYELSLTYAELCDIIICDFNYLYDPFSYIKRFFNDGGNYAFLVDEAHNLPERAREAYSCEITVDEITEPLYSELLGEGSALRRCAGEYGEMLNSVLYPLVKEEIRENDKGAKVGAVHLSEVPYQVYEIFEALEGVCKDELFKSYTMHDVSATERSRYIRGYLTKLQRINNILSVFDSRFQFFIFFNGGDIKFKLFCIDTGGVIGAKAHKGSSSVYFSATLTPLDYYRSLLGMDRSARAISVASPFDPSQLSVAVIDKISTRFSEREDTVGAICRTIAATVSARRGNYMIFSPSFAYSKIIADAFIKKYPKIKVLVQTPEMTYSEKKEFLAEFEKESSSYLIGFCVMGGVYSEGIDLIGDKLIGAVVVGIGMPSLSYEREAISAYYEEKYESGKQYAYIYPGMNRVLQAAGRVIRGEEDRGVIVLIDDRFQDPIYKKSAPDLWRGLKFIPDALTLKNELQEFWKNVDEEKARG